MSLAERAPRKLPRETPIDARFDVPFKISPDLTNKESEDKHNVFLFPREFTLNEEITGRVHITKIKDYKKFNRDYIKYPAGPIPNIQDRKPLAKNKLPIIIEIELDNGEQDDYECFIIFNNRMHIGYGYDETDEELPTEKGTEEKTSFFALWTDIEEATDDVYTYFWPQEPSIFNRMMFLIRKIPDRSDQTVPKDTPKELINA